MEKIHEALNRKRQEVSQDFGARKYMKRADIEKKHLQRLRDEEKKELQSKSRVSSLPPVTGTTSSLVTNGPSSSASGLGAGFPPSQPSAIPSEEEKKIDELNLPRAEVMRRLRILKQPITLFGEDDDMRLARLKTIMKSGALETDTELMEGQRNDFLMDLTDLKKREKSGFLRRDKGKDTGTGDGDDGAGSGNEGSEGIPGLDQEGDHLLMKSNFDTLCDEDKILVFFKRLLKEWEDELEKRPDSERRTSKGKSNFATFKQCARYLIPLFKMCRKRMLPADIRQALMIVVTRCLERDYLSAMDQYIKLAIGNAPWPIGVTMVGIHERSAREKIYTNSVAHIMNDETTRKYLQSVKRLMTLCQRRYPSVPSKSVEFNSLANGSDLHSLLAEETTKTGNHVAEERLRLMAAESSSP